MSAAVRCTGSRACSVRHKQRRKMSFRFSTLAALAFIWPALAAAQTGDTRFELGVQLLAIQSGEFDAGDVGVSGRLAWRPAALLGVEAEVGVYPGDFPERTAFSRGRVEGLFGVTAGPGLGRFRPFVKLRPGFLTFRDAPRPFGCILIFPPPLACTLGTGRTSFAVDLGGGVEIQATPRTFVRLDGGDRLVRYTGPVFDRQGTVRADGFFGHDIRMSIGGGIKF
jgi:hypothetical protein